MSNQDDKKKIKLTGAPQLSDMILGNLKPRVGKETTRWMAGLTDDAMEAAEQAARMQGVEMLTSAHDVPPKPNSVTVLQFMDYLFDCFQQFETEYNRSGPAPQMTLSVERPTVVVETLRQSLKAQETRQVYRGRISTRNWTLLIRGHKDELEGFILPIDQLISFASDPAHYTQFLSMHGELLEDDDVRWTIDNVEISWDKIRSFGKQLLAALVHVALTGTKDEFVFTMDPNKHNEATTDGAKPVEQKKVDYSFNEHNPAFDEMGYETPGSDSGSGMQPARQKAPVIEDPNATQAIKIRPSAGAQGQSPTTQSSSSVDSGKLTNAFVALEIAFSDELDSLTAAGQAAFGKQDMATVQSVFDRTNKVKEVRDQVRAQIEIWKKTLS